MYRRVKVLLILVFTLGLVFSYSTDILAEDADQQKYYLGLKTSNIWIDGYFDGLEENMGYGLVFGATKDIYTCEISYFQSEHDILNISTTDLESLNISVKICPPSLLNKRSQPYGLIGWGLNKITEEDGLVELKYEGNGFHLGFGINCKINKKIAIDGSVAYYRYDINKIKVGDLEQSPRDDWEMINTVVSLGLQYYF
jgi:opacity protein-like surface antigen